VVFERADFGDRVHSAMVQKNEACSGAEALDKGSRWQPAWVPPGFVLANYTFSEADGHMETYTDGLASFSVFAKPLYAGDDNTGLPQVSTTVKKGATVVLMRLLAQEPEAVQVSVLGEIPSDTAARVIASVAAVKDNP
jgi:sigma-E factor negative regulatory protein RseB